MISVRKGFYYNILKQKKKKTKQKPNPFFVVSSLTTFN